jgi:hypothetical protein
MALINPREVGELVDAAVTAVSVLGGVMACCSGYLAARALAEDRPPSLIAQRVNEGVGEGFLIGAPAAVVTLIIELWI